MKKLLPYLLLISPLIGNSQTFVQVTNNGSLNKIGSTPSSFITIGTVTYFTANDGINGVELWKTDGTSAGTSLVKDINPGSGSSDPYYLTNLNGTLMFTANNGSNGAELWRSDGTDAGTYMVLDVAPGTSTGMPKGVYADERGKDTYTPLVIGTTMYFMGSNTTTGREVWKTDGTSAGTVILKDILASSSAYPANGHFTNIGGTLYFIYMDGTVGGHQLWKSDGTTAGTIKVSTTTISGMYAASTPTLMFFASTDKIFQVTTTGTVTSQTFVSVNGPTLRSIGNSVYFSATRFSSEGEELFSSNGGGNVLIKDINAGSASSSPASIVSVGGSVFFTAFDATNGRELWKTDGTSAGTVLVKDIFSGLRNSILQTNLELAEYNGALYFRADDGINGTEIWKSDGTALGTVIVKDIAVGASGSFPINFITSPSGLLFVATNGVNGTELWKSDGTDGGTAILKDVRTGANDQLEPGISSSFYTFYSTINNELYFPGTDRSNGNEPWKTSGSTAAVIKDVLPGNQHSNANNFTDVNGIVFFSATTELGTELWKTDGTLAGTVLVKDIYPGYYSSNPSNFCNVNGILFFSADNGLNGQELWKSDGTSAGTVMVKDIVAGSGFTGLFHFKNLNGTLLFGANDFTVFGQELWRSDGTAAGTTIVRDLASGSGAGILAGESAKPAVMNNVLYYIGEGTGTGRELVRSDGTLAGTYVVKDIYVGADGSSPSYFKVVGNNLFFVATTASEGSELWVSNGTDAGTQLVKDINTGTASASPSEMGILGNSLVFGATDTNGKELWITDGTNAGTTLLKDINIGTGSSNPSNFVTVGSQVYFYANDGTGGYDIWKTNGSVGGTILVSEIENTAGSVASYPMYLTGSTLYVIANTPLNGFQLWASSNVLPVRFTHFSINCSSASPTLRWTTANESNNDRFEIETSETGIEWKKVGTLPATHNSLNEGNYQFIDPVQRNLYRLKQIDKDGRFAYSPILKSNCGGLVTQFALYPNPGKDVLNIYLTAPSNDIVNLQIGDASGRVLINQRASLATGSNNIQMNISFVPAGIYLLKAITSSGVITKQFVVTK